MYCERIRSTQDWLGNRRHDTVFVAMGGDNANDALPIGIRGLMVARVWLFFSFYDDYDGEQVPCALVTWYPFTSEKPDEGTGM